MDVFDIHHFVVDKCLGGRVSEKESIADVLYWVCGHGVSLGRGMHSSYMNSLYCVDKNINTTCSFTRTRRLEEMILQGEVLIEYVLAILRPAA